MARKNILAGASPPGTTPAPAPPLEGESGNSGIGGFSGAGRIRVPADPERDLACCRLPLTDLGNAERWRIRFGRDFRFSPEIGWFSWDETRWRLLSEEKDQVPAEVIWSITLTVRAIRNEAALVAALGGIEDHPTSSDAMAGALYSWASRSQREGREKYLRGDDEEGNREIWLEKLAESEFAPFDTVVDFGKRKSSSTLLSAWAKTSEAAPAVGKIVRWVKGFADIVVQPSAFDADRMAINLLNGTLRLERKSEKRSSADVEAGKSEWRMGPWKAVLKPHDRADLITKLAPVKYSPRAACPHYDAFMLQVQPEDAMRRFIHQWGGLSLTGDIGEQKLAFFYGSGRNGKGTWVEAVAHLAGDYAGSIPIESFLDNGIKRRGDQATPDIARLPGVRFLRVSEPEKGASLNEGLIKMVTGGDPVDARHLNKGFFTFTPSFKMTISGNHKPKVKDTSDGIWRRMQLVPWEVTIDAGAVDRHLGEKLRAEASGILNRLLEGLIDWRTNGLIEPETVRLATHAYRDQSDELGRFLSAVCVVGEDPLACRVKSSELHEIYLAWCEQAGGSFWKQKGFSDAMIDKGFEKKQSNGIWWVKVRLRDGVTLEGVKAGNWPSAPEDGPGEADQGGAGWNTGPDDPPDLGPDDMPPDWSE